MPAPPGQYPGAGPCAPHDAEGVALGPLWWLHSPCLPGTPGGLGREWGRRGAAGADRSELSNHTEAMNKFMTRTGSHSREAPRSRGLSSASWGPRSRAGRGRPRSQLSGQGSVGLRLCLSTPSSRGLIQGPGKDGVKLHVPPAPELPLGFGCHIQCPSPNPWGVPSFWVALASVPMCHRAGPSKHWELGLCFQQRI